MDSDVATEEFVEGFSDIHPGVRPKTRSPKWPWFVAAVLIAIGIGIAIAWPVTVPYYTLSPGPVYDTADFITTEGGEPSTDG